MSMSNKSILSLLFAAGTMHAAIFLEIPATQYAPVTPLGDSLVLAGTTYASNGYAEAVALIDATFTFANSVDFREAEVQLSVLINGITMVYAGTVRIVQVGDQLRGQLVLPLGQGVTVLAAPGATAAIAQRVILPIPEPGTWGLGLIGLPLMLAGMYRRKRAGSTSRR